MFLARNALRQGIRRVSLLDSTGQSLMFDLEMAQLEWQPEQPNYLRLAVFRTGSDALQAYYWAASDATAIEFNRDWLQIWVEDAAAVIT